MRSMQYVEPLESCVKSKKKLNVFIEVGCVVIFRSKEASICDRESNKSLDRFELETRAMFEKCSPRGLGVHEADVVRFRPDVSYSSFSKSYSVRA